MSANPVVVITGGSAGIGRAAVQQFADAGYDVAILARGRAGLEGAEADVRSRGGKALGIRCDVADLDQVQEAADRVESELGPIDVWVNNAFVGSLAYAWDSSPAEFRRITEVTYFGQVHGMLAALRVMRPRNQGRIVNVSSSLAHRGIPLQSAYCGAKHAIKGFTESVAAELISEGSAVTVSLVTLPGVNTPQFDWNLNRNNDDHPMPVPPLYQPEVAAAAIVRTAAHPRHDVWVGVPTAATILGNRLAPGFVEWYLGRTGTTSQTTPGPGVRHGSNLFEPRDDEFDRGSHGSFDDQARTFDPVSWLSSTVGRTVGSAFGLGLRGLSVVLPKR